MTKRQKLILAFVIVNVLVILGFAVMEFAIGMTSEYVPSTEGHSLNLKPLLFIFAVFFTILAIVELVLGIFTYKGKKWAAIALICCEVISWISVFGTVAAVVLLVKPRDETKQS